MLTYTATDQSEGKTPELGTAFYHSPHKLKRFLPRAQ